MNCCFPKHREYLKRAPIETLLWLAAPRLGISIQRTDSTPAFSNLRMQRTVVQITSAGHKLYVQPDAVALDVQ
jgi:hypothetical protein